MMTKSEDGKTINPKEIAIRQAMLYRFQHDEAEIGGLGRGQRPSAKIKDPLRIDKFLRAGIIDAHQYAAGFYFATLYAASHRSEISLSMYSGLPQEEFAQKIFRELGIIGKVSSSDLYHKIFRLMTPHMFRVAFQVCVNEMSLEQLQKCFRLRRDNMKANIRDALHELGDVLEQARGQIEKTI